jgi:hypothetical protein
MLRSLHVFKLVFLEVIVQLRVHLSLFQIALCPLARIYLLHRDCLKRVKTTYILRQSQLLLRVHPVSRHLSPTAVANVGASASPLLLESMHLVIQILLLVLVLTRLVHDRLGDAPSAPLAPLLLVVVKGRVYASLLTRPHL